jgi:predicted AAA+ superfamily ATPase
MVLGSGRLDVFQKGGDSLAGRYCQAHIFPLTVAELGQARREFTGFLKSPHDINGNGSHFTKIWDDLTQYTGFPEPFFSASQTNYERWSQTYGHQLIREDVRDLTQIKNIDAVESLFFLLPSRVGSLLSVASLSRDLQVSFNSVKEWLEVFERFYLAFRISPWSKNVSRAITKEQKLYLMDYGQIVDRAVRFENMVALELLRAVCHWNDQGLGRFSLYFLRDKDGQEVDFFIVNKNVPALMVEVKLSEEEPSRSLRSFQNIFHVPAVQLITTSEIRKIFSNGSDKIMVATAADWLASLP